MKELKEIIRAYEDAGREGKRSALATVVHLDGSAYRRPGARMLITEDGKLTGAISGGCLEGDALRKAQLVIVNRQPMLVTYDTTDDDDAKLGVGLGCNGIISILIEPVNPEDENNPIAILKTVLAERQEVVLVTLFSLEQKRSQTGTCMAITQSGILKNSLPEGALQQSLLTEAMTVLETGTSVIKMYPEENLLSGFIEMISPAISFVVFGAGNDAIPLVEMAHILGWETTVVDGRANYATTQRFPVANQILVAKPEAAVTHVKFDKRTVVVLMTHNYNYDIAALRALLPLQPAYIGVLGPKKKLKRMVDELREEGVTLDDEKLDNVYGPTGLDIGAETAEEIALSIISEIKAVLSKRNGLSLREKEEAIHSRESQSINQRIL
jgi:xanthine/CO dehydrogenase XdhC/CoxF family maturation factor